MSRHRFSDMDLSAKPWLFTIARRQLARWYRREAVSQACRQRLGIQQVTVDDESLSRIEQQIDLEPTRRRVADALKDLPTGQADALWLRVGHQLTYAEVAARLGCTEAAARTRVCRGLAALSTRFDDLEEMLQ